MNVASVDCTTVPGYELCGNFGVQGFPSLYYLPEMDKNFYRYSGNRNLDALTKFVKNEEWISTSWKPIVKPTKKSMNHVLKEAG